VTALSRLGLVIVVVALTGCTPADPVASSPLPSLGGPSPYDLPLAAELSDLPRGATQLAKLCSRGGNDLVTRRFCAAAPPSITSLADLQGVLGLGFDGTASDPSFTLSAHSSSLVTRYVSSINPRAIVFSPALDGNFAVMAFTRGEQIVELASYDAIAAELNFYLVVFTQGCNARAGGCTKGELLTSAVERDWTGVTLYEDDDLENTPLDCKQCHQPGGPDTTAMLRMQERLPPHRHFFSSDGEGRLLVADFQAAHGTEGYGPIPGALIARSDPGKLAALVAAAGFAPQPNEFDSAHIAAEEAATGTSATWQSIYDEAASGYAIAVPYHELRASDADKLAAATAAYRDVLDGKRAPASLPDIRDVLAPGALRDMTLLPAPGLDGKSLLVQMCQQCHNDKLNQTISRARFDVTKLLSMSSTEKDLAIARIQSATNASGHMPPAQLRALGAAEVARMIDALDSD
jgi:hypothetical protein